MYWDPHTQTYMTPHRRLNPRLGRWTQPDPYWNITNHILGGANSRVLLNERYVPSIAAILQAGNLFIYCAHNPVRWIDSSGLEKKCMKKEAHNCWGGGGGAGGASGANVTIGGGPGGGGGGGTAPKAPTQPKVQPQQTQITRGSHATIRASEGRNVGTAINDVQRARPADVLIQDDGRWVVRGQGGRVHIIEPNGEIVTTMNHVTQANVQKKINSGEWSKLTLEQQKIFLEYFYNYVNWQ